MPNASVSHNALTTCVLAVAGIIGAFCVYRWRQRRSHTPPTLPTQWRQVATLTKLHLYPLKSGRRIELQRAECTHFGLRQCADGTNKSSLQLDDRSFLVVGAENGEFKTARTFPKMVLIEVAVHDEAHVTFDAPGMRQLHVKVPVLNDSNPEMKITLHVKEEIFALDCGDEAAIWVSRYIYGKETGLRLVFHDARDDHKRNITKTHQDMLDAYPVFHQFQSTGLYSDLTPVLLINQASVDDLNAKIHSDTLITPENFRPNLIVEGDGAPPFVEDYWQWMKIGGAILRNIKPCTRCMLTTINPETGVRNTDREPLRTLETYRKLKDVLHMEFEGELTVMGANLAVYQEGEINVNDIVYVGI